MANKSEEIYNTILKRRSIRRFQQKQVSYNLLEKLVNAARFAPSGGNLQPLEYIIVDQKNLVRKTFSALKWASYLKDGAPPSEKSPVAYIVLLLNRTIRQNGGQYDIGMAAENIMLTALEEGVGSCCIGSIDKNELMEILAIPGYCDVELVIALGYPDEISVPEDMADSVKYWVDENNIMHVPKRRLSDVLHKNFHSQSTKTER